MYGLYILNKVFICFTSIYRPMTFFVLLMIILCSLLYVTSISRGPPVYSVVDEVRTESKVMRFISKQAHK